VELLEPCHLNGLLLGRKIGSKVMSKISYILLQGVAGFVFLHQDISFNLHLLKYQQKIKAIRLRLNIRH
jgi:hypothetical protein